MKKLFVLVLIAATTVASAQKINFGIKGGLNYGATGDITSAASLELDDFEGDDKVGFHAGIFLQAKILGISLQPELVYTSLSTEFEDSEYNVSKLDIPVLLGFNIVGPLNIKVGPSFQYILSNDFEIDDIGDLDIDVEDPENSFTMGYQVGAGVQLGSLGLDLRYEGAFSDNSAIVDVANTDFSVDTRPSQWILSLSYRFGNKK